MKSRTYGNIVRCKEYIKPRSQTYPKKKGLQKYKRMNQSKAQHD
jgi:hypothetical protein